MNAQPTPSRSRQIAWPSVVTVISAAILIGAEVFGAAFAGGWALAIILPRGSRPEHLAGRMGTHHASRAVCGSASSIMIAFIRAAQRVEPFTRRA